VGGVLAVAAGEPAAGQRAVGQHADAVALAGGEYVVLDAAGKDGVGGLLGDEALAVAPLGGPLSFDDGRGGEGRVAEVADLALVDQVGERAQGLGEAVSGSQRWIW
jgi:hypothetical protein